MNINLPLDQMTPAEKLQAMEALWMSLSRDEESVPSPAWHEGVLKEREQKLQSGQEEFIDWEQAKRQLRDRRS
ncbi:MAG: addiction module protein [Verrucomicrobia bacterium]|nr:addiction module protein [Verrucomicrobiota bacterium]